MSVERKSAFVCIAAVAIASFILFSANERADAGPPVPHAACGHDWDCDDGQFCNGSEICIDRICYAGEPILCEDGVGCTIDICNEDEDQCEWILDDSFCQECGSPCYICICDGQWGHNCDGSCPCPECSARSGCAMVIYACDDDNICTDDSCDPARGCVNANNSFICDDGQSCSSNDRCTNGVCIGESDLDCEDNDPCTEDSCHDELGCVNIPNRATCEDGDPCTMGDTCSGGFCTGAPLDADDDGFASEACGGNDCDDSDMEINPDSDEACDGIDNDCDGVTDNLGTKTCGKGPCEVTVEVCVNGQIQECVPLKAEEFRERTCTDGIDNDCDGNIDYNDINCKGRTDGGDIDKGTAAGGGCGCSFEHSRPKALMSIFIFLSLIFMARGRNPDG